MWQNVGYKLKQRWLKQKASSENFWKGVCCAIKDDGEIQLKRERYTTTKVPG